MNTNRQTQIITTVIAERKIVSELINSVTKVQGKTTLLFRIAAKKRGVKFGRKPKLTEHQRSEVIKMLDTGTSIRGIARHFNVGVATIDRVKNSAVIDGR